MEISDLENDMKKAHIVPSFKPLLPLELVAVSW